MDNIYFFFSSPYGPLITSASTVFFGSALIYVLVKSKRSEKECSSGVASLSSSSASDGTQTDAEVTEINVLYGSQTGTAESFCRQLQAQASGNGFKVNIIDLEEAMEENFPECLVGYDESNGCSGRAYCSIFVMSTYGEGEPTDNSKGFFKMLAEKCGLEDEEMKDEKWLDRMEYCVFGLGSTAYETYNNIGKTVDKRLEYVGAKRIVPLGLGDDNTDLEGDFEKWSESLWESLQKHYESELGNNQKVKDVNEEVPPSSYVIEYVTGEEEGTDPVKLEKIHNVSKHYFTAAHCPIINCRELITRSDSNGVTGSPQSALHIEVDLSNGGEETKYQTADNLAVLPENDESVVVAVAKACSFDLNTSFRVFMKEDDSKMAHLFPTPCTIHKFLRCYCDLTSPPRRSELKLLSYFAQDPLDQKALLRLSSPDNLEEYREKILNRHLGLHDILTRLCPSITLSLNRFLQIIPRLQPRYYTISSSSSLNANVSSITVSVLRYPRDDGTWFEGICSNYLKNSASGKKQEKVHVYVRESTFRLPKDSSKPVIMIGPGTGIAPMRALLQERYHQKYNLKQNIGKNILYFGCRHATVDQLYSDEIHTFLQQGVLTHYYPAFSRDQKGKVYVQHLLEKHEEETWEMIDKQQASIFVCGAIQMGHDVLETLRRIVMVGGGMDMIEAKNYLDIMHHQGRFVQELWA